ncbi:MAG: sigma-54 dependent transcriptional regulator [Deltaproteobacteria bacterium]|nr:sigma-54 dependent transcriptional regulator [Deltaproteobacteria bacterium]
MAARILVCDDEELIRWSLSEHLKAGGYDVAQAEDGVQALEKIESAPPDALIVDLKMPRLDGMSVLRKLKEGGHPFPVIVITAHGALDSAIEATKLGAAGYLSKPFDLREITLLLEKVLEKDRLETEVRWLRDRVTSGYERLIGASASMQKVFETLTRLESVDAPTVLITGESGTGKDLVAQAIHARGPRKKKPYMEIDCAAMPETLIESELFGHEKGSFTDARQTKRGLFEVAAGGVLFLDEIGEMTVGTQAKLLRAIENRRFKRVGGVVEIQLDAAIIAATNRDLRKEVKAGRFREDLFFRLNVVPLEIPPLRRRPQDIEAITLALVESTARDLGRQIPGVSSDAIEALRAYPWPGNVRELRNVVERVVILKGDDDVIQLEELPMEVRLARASTISNCPFELPEDGVDLAAVERGLVEQALARTHGNQTQAAKLLGISRFALRHRIDKHGVEELAKPSSSSSSS